MIPYYNELCVLPVCKGKKFIVSKNQLERFFSGIIAVFILILIEILALLGLNALFLLEKWPFLIGFPVGIMVIVHFIPEAVYDFYEDFPALFYVVYFIEIVLLIILGIACHNKLFA